MTKNDKESLIRYFQKILNNGQFKFTNIVILDNIFYFENPRGKELKPFRISTDVYVNEGNVNSEKLEPIGKLTIHIEMFLRADTMFYGPLNSCFPTITRIKLIRKDKISDPLPTLNEYNDDINMTENSLIPDEILFSTEESNLYTEESY